MYKNSIAHYNGYIYGSFETPCAAGKQGIRKAGATAIREDNLLL